MNKNNVLPNVNLLVVIRVAVDDVNQRDVTVAKIKPAHKQPINKP